MRKSPFLSTGALAPLPAILVKAGAKGPSAGRVGGAGRATGGTAGAGGGACASAGCACQTQRRTASRHACIVGSLSTVAPDSNRNRASRAGRSGGQILSQGLDPARRTRP